MMDAARLVRSGPAREATVWLAWRPGDVEPRWVEVVTVPIAEGISLHARAVVESLSRARDVL
jgi:hypothetical protein